MLTTSLVCFLLVFFSIYKVCEPGSELCEGRTQGTSQEQTCDTKHIHVQGLGMGSWRARSQDADYYPGCCWKDLNLTHLRINVHSNWFVWLSLFIKKNEQSKECKIEIEKKENVTRVLWPLSSI
jgi:hypothetical protein